MDVVIASAKLANVFETARLDAAFCWLILGKRCHLVKHLVERECCCSRFRSCCFVASPPAYPERAPLLPTIRWHGTMIDMAFEPMALAAALTALG